MARPVTLFTGQWADLPLADLAADLGAWGFDGVELACWGDHFEVDRAVADPGVRQGTPRTARGPRPRLLGDRRPPRRAVLWRIRSTPGTRGSCRPRCGVTAIPKACDSAQRSG